MEINEPIKELTSLELLFNSLLDYKKEIFEFCGITLNYQPVKSVEKKEFPLSDSKWLQHKLLLINNNLSKHNAHLIINKEFNEKSLNFNFSDYRPIISLEKDTFSIELYNGIFFNRFLVYNKEHLLLQVEPSLKNYYPVSIEQYDEISNFVQIVTSELTQHPYFIESIPLNKN